MSSFEANPKISSDFTEYEFVTTSSDSFTPPEDIIMQRGPVWHGTAIGYHASFSTHVEKIPIISERFCGIKINYYDLVIIAYSVYLPTSGQDDEFLEELDLLNHDINNNSEKDSTIIIGIDANTSEKSTNRRQEAFYKFTENFTLKTVLPDSKPTFHHNNGTSESQIDHILTNNSEIVSFFSHLCKHDDPSNLSSHDAIIGELKLNEKKTNNDEEDFSSTYEDFTTDKINWVQNDAYEELTANVLEDLLTKFDEPEHLPSLAEMVSNMIAICAKKCFKTDNSRKPQKDSHSNKTPYFSKPVREAYKEHLKICKEWRRSGRPSSNNHPAKIAKLKSQRRLQALQREEIANKAKTQHNDLMETHDKEISEVYKKLQKIRGKHQNPSNISEINTFLGTYKGDNVLEGFRANTEYLCNEKLDDKDTDFSDDFLERCKEDLRIINEISEHEVLKIPPITLKEMKDIVSKKLKNNKACDIYKIKPEHLKYAGEKTLEILCSFINRVLENINYLAAPEFKTSVASVIHKGKGKPKNLHKSFRLVRVCPLIGRLIDEYIRPMAVKISKPSQSINQYGFTENISYLMGTLQRHEAQKYCIDTKTTFFGCSLDGDSAFEVVCRTIQQRELYFAGETGGLSQYNDSYYQNTETRIKMKGKISKPLVESLGVASVKARYAQATTIRFILIREWTR